MCPYVSHSASACVQFIPLQLHAVLICCMLMECEQALHFQVQILLLKVNELLFETSTELFNSHILLYNSFKHSCVIALPCRWPDVLKLGKTGLIPVLYDTRMSDGNTQCENMKHSWGSITTTHGTLNASVFLPFVVKINEHWLRFISACSL